ncbi:hypothetical protein PVAG01_10295 [Phlyctema vagabunda]|uniref:Transcription factor domain-containing protein n=1 Tax=Phlyctema vagabunda TaxID=108571 RepID=A0ABR4P5I9_9HELO
MRQGVSCDYSQPLTFLDTTSVTKKRAERDQNKKSVSLQGREVQAELLGITSNDAVQEVNDVSSTAQEYAASLVKDEASETSSIARSSPAAGFQIKSEVHSPRSSMWEENVSSWDSSPSRESIEWVSGTNSGSQDPPLSEIPRFNFMSGLPIINSSERRYLSHFNNVVSDQLPIEFQSSKRMAMSNILLRNTILALSASNLSLLEAHRWEVSHGGVREKQFARQGIHREQALHYYALAIRLYPQGTLSDSSCSTALLGASILMAHFEFESGSPKGFFAHVRGADALVLAKHTEIAQSACGRDFLSCWANLHARQDFMILPFRTLNLEREFISNRPGESKLVGLIHVYGSGNANLLKFFADAHRVSQRVHMVRCMRIDGEDSTSTLRRSLEWYSNHWRFPFSFDIDLSDEEHGKFAEDEDLMEYTSLLRSKLDAWHAALPSGGLPLETSPLISLTSDPNKHPLRFQTPRAANDYICYALAQLMASEEILNLSSSQPNEELIRSTMPPWSHLVLRCIAGLDFNSLEISSYSINIILMLRCLSESPPNRAVLKAMLDGPLARLESVGTLESLQGNFAMWHQTFRFRYEQIINGKAVFLLHPLNSLAADSTTRDYYPEVWVAIHGRHLGGGLFSEFVQIP